MVIFLGYLTTDPEFTFILREAACRSSSYQHIALMLKSDVSSIEKKVLRSNYKVDPILYDDPSLLLLFVMEMRSFYRQQEVPLRIKPDVAKLERALNEIKKSSARLENCPIVVFGSFAKYGHFLNPEADVDVLLLPSDFSDESRIQSSNADKIFGKKIDATVIDFSEFARLLRHGDPFASSVLLTGCPIKDTDERYGILSRGFRGKYRQTDVMQNAHERYCLRWLRLCIYKEAEHLAYLQACYQWAITLMQMFIIKDDYQLENLLSIGLLGNPRYVIHEFALRFDNVDESFYLALMQAVKRPSASNHIKKPTVDEMIRQFRSVLKNRFKQPDLKALLPGTFLLQGNPLDIIKIYKKVNHFIEHMCQGKIRISLGYGGTNVEESFIEALNKNGITAFDYLFFIGLYKLVKKVSTTKQMEDESLLKLCCQAQSQWQKSPAVSFTEAIYKPTPPIKPFITPEELWQIISQPEGLKLDFKREYKLDSIPPAGTDKQKWSQLVDGQWDELIKDIIALTNGNVGTADQSGKLIIGVGDQLLPDGTRHLYDTSDLHLTAQQILARVNSACDPPIPDIRCEQVMLKRKNIWVIEIPPSPHIHETSRALIIRKGKFDEAGQLRSVEPGRTYTARTAFIRRGENIFPATREERRKLEEEKRSK